MYTQTTISEEAGQLDIFGREELVGACASCKERQYFQLTNLLDSKSPKDDMSILRSLCSSQEKTSLGKVDPDVIHLVGRWHSDEMLRYLQTQAAPLMTDYA
ncbi:hypothetical protein ACHAWF_004866 [Thalassiosira exigua]